MDDPKDLNVPPPAYEEEVEVGEEEFAFNLIYCILPGLEHQMAAR